MLPSPLSPPTAQGLLESTYYPAISLFTLPSQPEPARVTVNFGEQPFAHPPAQLEGLGGEAPTPQPVSQLSGL